MKNQATQVEVKNEPKLLKESQQQVSKAAQTSDCDIMEKVEKDHDKCLQSQLVLEDSLR